MKEYKIIVPKLGFTNRMQNLEDLLNQYGREGWKVIHIAPNWANIALERNKNR
ncbi:DUF4177 domain-containing protein [Bizionia argentinensis JUB59]|uniref:DUF4177 domain-containing protein n=1 Tax=Bizionia argentinensis JUB59 TaxID=1046627 RepID=G2EG29_9FLAO|nr:DUF4177 domain-containing protein [Bizionia argentinensis]EGV42551.1 DUF4177 domain-containing protein [Bizionia argentinensis JUB59]